MVNSFFIVEDHSLMLYGISNWLSENSKWKCCGYAQNKTEALKKIQKLYLSEETSPSIIITDINLNSNDEDLTGLNFIKEIISSYDDVKCICYSMYSSPGIINKAFESGAQGYVTKNCKEKELIECMNQVQNGQRYIEKGLESSIVMYNELISSLTQKELEIVNLLMTHKSNDEISEILNIKKRTVETYTSRIYDKIGCKNRNDLTKILTQRENF